MVCITSAPTADLSVYIPAVIAGGGWAWSPHPRFAGVLASEYVYTAREAISVVRTYARALALQIRPPEAPRYTVIARGRVTGMILARDEWVWRDGAFVPDGEPWETWRAAARKYYELTGKMIDRQKFKPCLLPHLRAREDVPHEHALPDLYGLRRLNAIPAPRVVA